MEELIAKRYAKALLDVSNNKDLQGILEELKALSESLSSKKIAEAVSNPLISNESKFKTLILPLKDKMNKNLFRLVEIMSENGRLSLIPTLRDILEFEIKKRGNRFEGTIESDGTLKRADITKLEKRLSEYTGAKISLKEIAKDRDGLKVEVEDLGIELSYSKERVKADLLAFIEQGL